MEPTHPAFLLHASRADWRNALRKNLDIHAAVSTSLTSIFGDWSVQSAHLHIESKSIAFLQKQRIQFIASADS